MSYYNQPSANNLQFYQSSYGNVSGHTTPSQASYGGYSSNAAPAYPGYTNPASNFAGTAGIQSVSGRMGEQGGLRTGWLAAFGTEGYDGEPGLMEEIGINFGHIKSKTLTVLNPIAKPSPHIMDDSDLYGGLLFLVLYGTFLALSGKFLYSSIYGIALFGSIMLHWVFALMTPPLDPNDPDLQSQAQRDHMSQDTHGNLHRQGGHFSSTLTYSRSASVLGYCFLPLTFTALIGIVMPMDSGLGYCLTAVAVGWCTYSSSGMFVSVGRMKGMRGLVAYPLALFYLGFGIMGLFSSLRRGQADGRT